MLLKDLPNKGNKGHQWIYFIRIGDKEERLFKIGTTNNPKRRMTEHRRGYGKKIHVIWLSPPLKSRFSTLRVEENMINLWRETEPTWQYMRNDRFIIPIGVEKVSIKIRKEYEVLFS